MREVQLVENPLPGVGVPARTTPLPARITDERLPRFDEQQAQGAESGDAYRVMCDAIPTPHGVIERDMIVNGRDFPELERLVRIKALMPMPGVKVPRRLSSNEDLLDSIQQQQNQVVSLQDRLDAAQSELAAEKRAHEETKAVTKGEMEACYKEIKGLEEQLIAARKGMSPPEKK